MNTFLSNVEKNLNFADSEEVKLSAGTKSNPILKAIFEYSKNPSIIVTKNTANRSTFQFSCVSFDDVFKETKKTQDA